MTRRIRLRTLLFGGLFTLFFVGLLARVYWVQVVEASTLLSKAEQMWETDKVLPPKRGSILDRMNRVLAEDAPGFTVAVKPQVIHEKQLEDTVSRGLAEILETSGDAAAKDRLQKKIYEQITRKKQDGVSLYAEVEIRNEGWKIDTETADKVRQLIEDIKTKEKVKDAGIYLKSEQIRSYPGDRLASHLLGYTNKEGTPVMGLEASYDDVLKGTAGSLKYEKDPKGVELPDAKVSYVPPVDGKDLVLTIDKNIQFYVENALRKAYEQYHPKSMIGIAADPKTMEILGMASLPDFNPNRYWETVNQSDFINRAVASQFEPGSTFKLVTLAGAVQEGVFHPNDTYVSGSIKVPGRTLHDWDQGWGRITYLDGLKRSSNVAFVKLGYEMLGENKLMDYINRFGFGQKTGIDIAGEVGGVVNMKYPSEFATATYGQGLTVTAIQETAAYAAIANGGKLMWPHVVKAVLDPHSHEVVQSFEPKVVRQVVTEETAKQVSEYLEQVVSDQNIGTGRAAYMEEYRIAGKTGTANIVVPGEKGYSPDQWVFSFIGYAPVEDPRILITIIADRPDIGKDWHAGSKVTIPAFREILTESLRYMGVAAKSQQKAAAEEEKNVSVPELAGMTVDAAKTAASQAGLSVEVLGNGQKVVKQYPESGTEIGTAQRIYLITQEDGELPVPDLTGKSLRDAMEICSLLHLQCRATGEGYVAGQSVSEENGTKVLELQLAPMSELAKGTPSSDAASANKTPDSAAGKKTAANKAAAGKPPAQKSSDPTGGVKVSAQKQ